MRINGGFSSSKTGVFREKNPGIPGVKSPILILSNHLKQIQEHLQLFLLHSTLKVDPQVFLRCLMSWFGWHVSLQRNLCSLAHTLHTLGFRCTLSTQMLYYIWFMMCPSVFRTGIQMTILSGGWAGPFGGFKAKNLQCLPGSSFLCVTCVPKITQKTQPIWAEFLHIWKIQVYIYTYILNMYIYIISIPQKYVNLASSEINQALQLPFRIKVAGLCIRELLQRTGAIQPCFTRHQGGEEKKTRDNRQKQMR